MNARATITFYGARDGELYPTRFEPGDPIEGELAAIAVREKWAEEIAPLPAEARSAARRKQVPSRHVGHEPPGELPGSRAAALET